MAGLYLVAVDFELWRGVHARVGRGEYVAVGLCCVGVAGLFFYDDTSAKGPVRLVEDGVFE